LLNQTTYIEEQMKLSVVICTYGMDRLNDLEEAVNSILNQSYQDFEILIIADNSERLISSLEKRLTSGKVKIISCEAKGLSNARNLGVKYSTGDVVAFLDDDAIADKNWLSYIVKNYMEDVEVIGVGGRIISAWEGTRPEWFPDDIDWIVGCTYKGHPEEKCCVRNIIGCNMSFRKKAFNKIGRFESSIGRVGKHLLAGEEMEFCVRLLQAYPQAKIIYDPSIVVHHKVHSPRQSLSYMLKRAYNEGISKSIISKLELYRTQHNVLSTENLYLKHIAVKAIPYRLSNIFRGRKIKTNFKHIVALSFAITMVILGYAFGRIAIRKA